MLKMFSQRISDLINELSNYEGVCRTDPAKPGLLIMLFNKYTKKYTFCVIEDKK